MAFRSMEQLRSKTWPSRETAVKELKANGFKPTGADYEIRENSPGSWLVMPLGDGEGEQAPAVAAKAAKAPAKTAGAKVGKQKSSQRQPPLGGKSAAEKKAADAKLVCSNCEAPLTADNQKAGTKLCDECAGRSSNTTATPPVTVLPERAAHGVKRTPQSAKLNGKVVPATVPAKAPETVPETPTPPEPANDMTALPTASGPYTIRVGEEVPQFNLAELALLLSQQTGLLMSICDKGGKVARTLDGRIGAGRRSRSSSPRSSSPRTGTPRGEPKPLDEMATTILGWAKRKQGVKRTEMSELNGGVVINWKQYLERIGRRENLVISVNKEGPTPIYWLKPA